MDTQILSLVRTISSVHDDDLQALKVAASKAQEAATRCERQATDLFQTRHSNLPVEPASSSGSSPSSLWSTTHCSKLIELPTDGKIFGEGSEQEKKDEAPIRRQRTEDQIGHACDRPREVSSLASDTVPQVEMAGDSGLGESLSDTEGSTQRESTIGILSFNNVNAIEQNSMLARVESSHVNADTIPQQDISLIPLPETFAPQLSEEPKASISLGTTISRPIADNGHLTAAQKAVRSLILIFTFPGKQGSVSSVRRGFCHPTTDFGSPINITKSDNILKKRGEPQNVVNDSHEDSKPETSGLIPISRRSRAELRREIMVNSGDGFVNRKKLGQFSQQPQLTKPTTKRPHFLFQTMATMQQSLYVPDAKRSEENSAPITNLDEHVVSSGFVVEAGLEKLKVKPSDRSIKNNGHILELSLADNTSFLKAFEKNIYPTIKSTAEQYNNILSSEKILSIGKKITSDIVSKDFQLFMRRRSYALNHEQIAKIQRYIEDSFHRETLKSLNPNFFRGSSSNLTPKDSNPTHVSVDLSLLGPGKTVESAAPFAFVSDPPPEEPVSLNQSAARGYQGGPIIAPEFSKKGQYRALTHLENGKPQLRTSSVGRARTRLKSSQRNSNTLKLQESIFASGVGTDHQPAEVPGLATSTQRENCKEDSKGCSQLKRKAPINLQNGQKQKASASPLLGIPSNSAKPTKHAKHAKPTLSSDSEDLANVEDDRIILASWMSEVPDKMDQNPTLMSNDVLGPQSPMSSSGLMTGVPNESSRASHHASPNVDFDSSNSKRVSKKNVSPTISASVTRHSGNTESFNGSEIESSHSSRRSSSHSPGGLDFEVSSDGPDNNQNDSLRTQDNNIVRKSQYTPPKCHGLRTPISEGTLLTSSDPYLEMALSQSASGMTRSLKPYNQRDKHLIKPTDTHGTLKHVDFSDDECKEILQALTSLFGPIQASDVRKTLRHQIQSRVQHLSYDAVTDVITHVHSDTKSILQSRKRKYIRSFLSDLRDSVPDRPKLTRVEVQLVDPLHNPQRSTASLLRSRELGLNFRGHRNVRSELRLKTTQNISPWKSWKGASGDIVACAWAPNAFNYAVGAAALDNDEDLQYNRPRNLLYGDLNANTLKELPDHRVDRPKPEMIASGPNSTQAVYDACDPMIYKTVSSVQFSRDGCQLYTASHDMKVKIWDTASTEVSCIGTLNHSSKVIDLDVSQQFESLFATASKSIDAAVRVYYPNEDDFTNTQFSYLSFTSSRAVEKPQWELFPGCVKWGAAANTANYLLAGFMQWGEVVRGSSREGHICLWDVPTQKMLKVTPGSQSVFTATWHPLFDMFATGGGFSRGRPLSHPTTTRSVVRVWDMRTTGLARDAVEFECPACDMQDITFNPLFPHIVTAGCTDSVTYVWDSRKADQVLLKLEHGRPLQDWDHTKPQDEGDTGVMMTLWGLQGSRFYTGSSDGIVKCWDTLRAPEDAFIRNVADLGVGVTSGAFSPDFSHLLVGDADGGAHILTAAPIDDGSEPSFANSKPSAKPIDIINAPDIEATDNDSSNEGILAAQNLLKSGELVLNKRYGVGKGPNYKGPFALYARQENSDPLCSSLLPEFEAMQPFAMNGYERPEITRRIQGMVEERKLNIAMKQQDREVDDNTKEKKYKSTSLNTKRSGFGSSKTRIKRSHSQEQAFLPSKKPKYNIIDLSSPPPSALATNVFKLKAFTESSRENPIELDSDSDSNPTVEDNIIPESEMLEENYWWPRWDEDLFRKLRVGASAC